MLRLSTGNRLPHVNTRCLSNLSNATTERETAIGSQDTKKNVSDIKRNTCQTIQKPFKSAFQVYNPTDPRYNDFNIQMIPKSMRDHLFGKNKQPAVKNIQKLKKAAEELKKHGLMTDVKRVPYVDLNLPKLEGETIDDHFYSIGEKQSGPYRELVSSLLTQLPNVPSTWELREGWIKYTSEGCTPVDYPEEDALVFDVEVCMSEGQMPTLATAVGKDAWYGWVSKDLVQGSRHSASDHYTLNRLIPLESKNNEKGINLDDKFTRPRIVIGHNVSYDRARVKEQYWLERTGMRFLDTMSLHVAVSGVTSYQKNLLKAGLGQDDEWSKLSSLNSLSKVHNLYCGNELSKEERDIFVTGSLTDVSANFQSLMSYCANDVIATHNILRQLFPMYLIRFPHPVSLAGILELGLSYLPVNSNWNQYIKDCNETYSDLESEIKLILSRLADEACQLLHNEEYKKNLWLWDQDWTVKKLKMKKTPVPKKKKLQDNVNQSLVEHEIINESACEESEFEQLEKQFKYLLDQSSLLPARPPHLPGYPVWYSKLCPRLSSSEWAPGPHLLSTGMQVTPKLLSLTWKSLPLHHVQGHGWGMLVPFKTDIEIPDSDKVPIQQLVDHCLGIQSDLFCTCSKMNSDGLLKFECNKRNLKKNDDGDSLGSIFCKAEIGNGCGLIKLPHKDGKHLNVGNPLARDYIHKFSKDSLGSGNEKTERLIEISRMLSYWRNNRERVENQLTVWLLNNDVPKYMVSNKELGAILPQVIVCGTLTRRAVEPTWMTASNALEDRVGSELRAMINSPPSHCLVGADVDSQELWIASVIGDAHSHGQHGATPFGWMTLSGQKSDGTDMHSVTAKAVGISRNHAKVINYARIYGAGQPFAEHLLKQFNPEMESSEARQKAAKMFSMTKGKRLFILQKNVLPHIRQRVYTKYGAKEICSVNGKSVEELFEKPKWVGGTESEMFNRLEEIASYPQPKTPFLKGLLSRALEPKADVDDKFLPTRINWVVQSGAVDFLHLMLVNMRWLMGPHIRFCLSFHDEVRYLVPKSQRYQATLALHVTNLFTRAFCASQLGLTDLPLSVAFFSSVDVDTVLRKESDHDCITPSNPFGLNKGYGIPTGESLDFEQAVRKARGIVGLPGFRRKNTKTS